MDYHFPLLKIKYLGLIPNPINTTKIDFKPLEIEDKIIIFTESTPQITIKGNDFSKSS
jgi:hypothetical protein